MPGCLVVSVAAAWVARLPCIIGEFIGEMDIDSDDGGDAGMNVGTTHGDADVKTGMTVGDFHMSE